MHRWQTHIAAAWLIAIGNRAAIADDGGYADVIAVVPIHGQVREAVAQRYCWKERGASTVTDRPSMTRRCTTVVGAELREATIGYRVKYQHRGRIGHLRTEYHPGRRIRVQYDLQPIHF